MADQRQIVPRFRPTPTQQVAEELGIDDDNHPLFGLKVLLEKSKRDALLYADLILKKTDLPPILVAGSPTPKQPHGEVLNFDGNLEDVKDVLDERNVEALRFSHELVTGLQKEIEKLQNDKKNLQNDNDNLQKELNRERKLSSSLMGWFYSILALALFVSGGWLAIVCSGIGSWFATLTTSSAAASSFTITVPTIDVPPIFATFLTSSDPPTIQEFYKFAFEFFKLVANPNIILLVAGAFVLGFGEYFRRRAFRITLPRNFVVEVINLFFLEHLHEFNNEFNGIPQRAWNRIWNFAKGIFWNFLTRGVWNIVWNYILYGIWIVVWDHLWYGLRIMVWSVWAGRPQQDRD